LPAPPPDSTRFPYTTLFRSLANNAVYGATKGWVHAFSRGVAVEQARHGVRANCICPGPVDTAWTHKETGPMNRKMEKMITQATVDRKSTRLNSSHVKISYAV